MKKYSKLDKNKKHNIFYKITSNDGKYYYGRHSTDNINDGYMGSGAELRKAIKKLGKDKFKKEIIHDFPTYEQAFDFEKWFITEEMINSDMCYNLHTGGAGGLQWNKNHPRYEEIKRKCVEAGTNRRELTVEERNRQRQGLLGRKVSDTTKQKLREKNIGKLNPQFGKSGDKSRLACNYEIIQHGKLFTFYGTLHDFAKKNGHSLGGLHNVMTGKRNSHHGITKITKY